jgi:hypothetical protein
MSSDFNARLALSLDSAREGGKINARLLDTGAIRDIEELAVYLSRAIMNATRSDLESMALAYMLSETLNAQADAILSEAGSLGG